MSKVATRRVPKGTKVALTDPIFKMSDRHRKAYAEMLRSGTNSRLTSMSQMAAPRSGFSRRPVRSNFRHARTCSPPSQQRTRDGWLLCTMSIDTASNSARKATTTTAWKGSWRSFEILHCASRRDGAGHRFVANVPIFAMGNETTPAERSAGFC
jgi:hypothetical protein